MTMPLEIVTVPCLSDNYAFLLHNPDTAETAVVDAPEAEALTSALSERGWGLDHILLTHHHWDHIGGVAALRDQYGAQVIGAAADAHRLPPLDIAVSEGDQITLLGADIDILDVSGHTVGHIAFHMPQAKALFTADSLMALGCGRLFEGTPGQMWGSLQKMAALPADTIVYPGHEYTEANARFAITIEPGNDMLVRRIHDIEDARAANKPTVPSRLSEELATNPFLRPHVGEVKKSAGLPNGTEAEVFAQIRAMKDNF
ncbi:hydroxyacylglutathione hydrolase [Phaeobacter sp.]|uniref:hydroxyacylglutathione hydrolase n=1 Tax=Phaeobacter sp. TaxID=1902409 RepID=UPI0025FA1DDE|nr:hydroxyacylglutathione hydrolase [Phaeobacter sp.]